MLGPALVFTFAARPYVERVEQARAHVERERELLMRELRLLAAASSFPRAAAAALRADNAAAQFLLEANDAYLAASEFSRNLRLEAKLANVLLRRVEFRGVEPGIAGITALRFDVRAESDLEGLLTLLRRLENGPPIARVEALHIHSSAPGAVATPPEVEVLSLSATVLAYLRDADAGRLARPGPTSDRWRDARPSAGGIVERPVAGPSIDR